MANTTSYAYWNRQLKSEGLGVVRGREYVNRRKLRNVDPQARKRMSDEQLRRLARSR